MKKAWLFYLIIVHASLSRLVLASDVKTSVLPTITTKAEKFDLWQPSNKDAAIQVKEIELKRSIQRNVSEHLRGRPGISILGSGEGRLGGAIQLRGVTAGQNAITFDGVPLLSTVPGENWLSAISGEAIGGISVITGGDHAYQSLQGTNGAIRLSSRQAHRNNLGFHIEGGSLATMRETVSGGLSGKWGNINLVGSRTDLFNGTYFALPNNPSHNERDPAHNSLGTVRYTLNLGQNALLDGSTLYREGHYNFDPQLGGTGKMPNFVDTPDTSFSSRLWLTQKTLSLQLTDNWFSTTQLGFTRNEVGSRIAGHPFAFATQLMFADWRNIQRLMGSEGSNSLRWIWGSHIRQERGEQNNPGNPGLRSNRSTVTGYTELQGQWRDIYLESGARIEHHSGFGLHPVFYASSRWQVTDVLTLRAKAANNFRPPDFGELFNTITVNPNLTREKGFNTGTGFDWQINSQTYLSVTGFYGRFNGLVNLEINPNQGFFSYINIPNARIYGVESTVNQKLSHSVVHGAEYTYQQAEDLDTNQLIAMRPKHTARYWVEWKGKSTLPLTLRATVQYRSDFFNGSGERFHSGDAIRASLLGTYQASKALDLYVRGENINNDRSFDAWSLYHTGVTVYGGLHFRM